MENKIKILYFVDRMLKGGIQALVIEIAKNIDKKRFQLDFLLLDDGHDYELENTLKELDCNVYKLKNVWIRNPFDYINYYKEMKNFFKETGKNYDIVHLHSSSKNFLFLYFAKKNNIKVRIAHSHNTGFKTTNKIEKQIGNILKKFLIKNATDFMACSKDAGRWLFGEKKEEDIVILKNAIDIDKYKYNEQLRKNIRDEYNISEDDIVCGNIGRIVEQKNHEFLIEIFKEICKINQKYKLMIVGKPEKALEKKIEGLVKKYNIEKNVILTGFKNNSNEYLNAMDLFLFPSKFEGLGIALIEAQANGLKCIVSENIPEEAKVSDNVITINLNKEKVWIEKIINIDKTRNDCRKQIEDAGYDIREMVKNLDDKYEKMMKYNRK